MFYTIKIIYAYFFSFWKKKTNSKKYIEYFVFLDSFLKIEAEFVVKYFYPEKRLRLTKSF